MKQTRVSPPQPARSAQAHPDRPNGRSAPDQAVGCEGPGRFGGMRERDAIDVLDGIDAIADAQELARGSSDLALALATSPYASAEALLSLARILDECAESLAAARAGVEGALRRLSRRAPAAARASYALVGIEA